MAAERRLEAVEHDDERGDRLTIDELARETGMTVRNIRNHQSRGLLPPPEVVARTGYYGPEHVERLNLIREMQADGFNLSAIKNLLTRAPEAAGQILGIKRAVSAPLQSERPEILTEEELVERFGELDAKVLDKARRLDFLVPVGEGHYQAPSPALLRVAEEVAERGISLSAALHVVEQVQRNCQSIARSFTKLFLDELWKPVRDADGAQRWPEVAEGIERLRPVAGTVVQELFHQTLSAEIERAFAKELERHAKR